MVTIAVYVAIFFHRLEAGKDLFNQQKLAAIDDVFVGMKKGRTLQYGRAKMNNTIGGYINGIRNRQVFQ